MKSHFKVVGWACRAAGGRVGEDKQTQLKTLPPPPCSRLSQFKRYIERMRPTGAGNIHFPLLSICTYCRMSREFVKKRQNFKTMAMAVFAIIAIEADILCVRDRAFLSYHVILQICFCFWCEVALISGRRAAGQAGVTRNISLICEGLLKLGPLPLLHIWWYWIVESKWADLRAMCDNVQKLLLWIP